MKVEITDGALSHRGFNKSMITVCNTGQYHPNLDLIHGNYSVLFIYYKK